MKSPIDMLKEYLGNDACPEYQIAFDSFKEISYEWIRKIYKEADNSFPGAMVFYLMVDVRDKSFSAQSLHVQFTSDESKDELVEQIIAKILGIDGFLYAVGYIFASEVLFKLLGSTLENEKDAFATMQQKHGLVISIEGIMHPQQSHLFEIKENEDNFPSKIDLPNGEVYAEGRFSNMFVQAKQFYAEMRKSIDEENKQTKEKVA